MAIFLSDDVLDGALDIIATGDKVILCSAQPLTYAEAIGTYDLATASVDAGDFTKENNTPNGRKITVAQQVGATVDHTGEANYVAIVDDGGSRLLAVTTVTPQTVTQGNTVTINAFALKIPDVVAS